MSPRLPENPSTRPGMALTFIIPVLFVFVVFALTFFQAAKHGKAMTRRSVAHETLTQIAESAMEEAFSRFRMLTSAPGSPAGIWLISRSPEPFRIPLDLVVKEAQSAWKGVFDPKITAEARVFDFRRTDSQGRRYICEEGVGRLQITVQVTLASGRGIPQEELTGRLVRHHDFKVASIVSPRDNSRQRAGYAHNFILDYALLVREGFREFREISGQSLHSSQPKVVLSQEKIPPDKRGKVYFGETGEGYSGQLVFLNLPSKISGLLPQPLQKEVQRVRKADCLALVPKLAEIEKVSPGSLENIEGIFEEWKVPLVRPIRIGNRHGLEKKVLACLSDRATGAEKNLDPPVDILSENPSKTCDPEFARSILEGNIRQRFLRLVTFRLDLRGSPLGAAVGDAGELPCMPLPREPVSEADLRTFLERLEKMEAARANGADSLLSSLNQDFPFLSGLSDGDRESLPSFPNPSFFDAQGNRIRESSEGFRAFGHVNLWNRRFFKGSDLLKSPTFDQERGLITLRGIEWVDDDVEIGPPGRTWTVQGQGVLIARGFKIRAGIRKSRPQDLLVLCARTGNIDIGADERVEASLIALGNPNRGRVVPEKTAKIFGAVAVERIGLPDFPGPGKLEIEYDPMLKVPDALYQVDISPVFTFRRWSEDSNE